MGEIVQLSVNWFQSGDEVVHLHPVVGDAMEPTARTGDVWVFRAADLYDGPGIYAISDGLSYPQFRMLEKVPACGLQILGMAVAVVRRS